MLFPRKSNRFPPSQQEFEKLSPDGHGLKELTVEAGAFPRAEGTPFPGGGRAIIYLRMFPCPKLLKCF